jgi:hypothetical protein
MKVRFRRPPVTAPMPGTSSKISSWKRNESASSFTVFTWVSALK